MTAAAIILFGIAALMLVLGAAVRFGRAYFLISGYNTASPEEKAHVNTRGVGREIWRMCLTLAVLFTGGAALLLAGREWGLLAFVCILPVTFIFMWRMQKYDGSACDENGRVKRQRRTTLCAVLAIPTLITAGTLVLVWFSAQMPAVTFADGELSVSGIWHETIEQTDIRRVELLDTMPAVASKRSGTDVGTHLMGNFVLKGGQAVRLYVDTSRPPFLRITEKDGSVTILSAGTAAKTRTLYAALGG